MTDVKVMNRLYVRTDYNIDLAMRLKKFHPTKSCPPRRLLGVPPRTYYDGSDSAAAFR